MISILLCTFNGAEWLPFQLKSLLTQELLPSEVVVCDDCSTDETLIILKQFRDEAPFPVIIHSNIQRLGYAANFLHGISLTKNSLVAFCDQDDIWLPDKLLLSHSVLTRTSALLVAHGFDLIDKKGRKLGSTFDHTGPLAPNGYRLGSVGCAGFSLLLDKRLLGYAPSSLSFLTYTRVFKLGGSPTVGHDALLCELASCLNAGAFIAKPLVLHRIHGNNASKPKSLAGKAHARHSLFRKALTRWSERKSGCGLYSTMASELQREALIYTIMSREVMASGCSSDYLNEKVEILRLREKDNLLRAALYAHQSSGLLGFLKMLLQGCYARGGGRLGPFNAVKDFLIVLTYSLGFR